MDERLFGMTEARIPDPPLRIDLPGDLVGEYIIPQTAINIELIIYPSNKYLIKEQAPDSYGEEYGYVEKRGDTYFFVAFKNGMVYKEAEIQQNEKGFLFWSKKNTQYQAVRKRYPRVTPLSETVTIVERRAKSSYFIVSTAVGETIFLWHSLWTNIDIDNVFRLQIENGNVVIYQPVDMELVLAWNGVFEVTEKTGHVLQGKLLFTNSIPYKYIENGEAALIMEGDSIKISAVCALAIENYFREKYPDVQLPIYFIAEF
jgi:hypothetical protein